MAKRYFVLIVREGASAPWTIEFGDYDRDVVRDERDDYADHGARRSDLMIITTSDDQASIDQAVARLNAVTADRAATQQQVTKMLKDAPAKAGVDPEVVAKAKDDFANAVADALVAKKL